MSIKQLANEIRAINNKVMVARLREYGNITKNYENGWDVLIEARTDAEIIEYLNEYEIAEFEEAVVSYQNDWDITRQVECERYTRTEW